MTDDGDASEVTEIQVWYSEDRSRFYAIPDGAEIRDGSLRLHKMGGRQRDVDPDAIVDWEISKEEANALIGDEMSEAWGELQTAFGRLLDFGRRAARETGAEVDESEVRPLPDLETILGMPPGDLYTDRDKAKAQVGRVFRRLTRPTESSQENEGKPPDQILAELGEKVREVFSAPVVSETVQAVGASLREAATGLREATDAQGASEEPDEAGEDTSSS